MYHRTLTTTLCWKCSKPYDMSLQDCPHCGSVNGNHDPDKALAEADALAPPTRIACAKSTPVCHGCVFDDGQTAQGITCETSAEKLGIDCIEKDIVFLLDKPVEPPPQVERVFYTVAIYEHRHGQDVRIFETDEQCTAWKSDIAETYWEKEIEDEIQKPEDYEELGDAYFEILSNRGHTYESFHTHVCEIELDPTSKGDEHAEVR